MRNDTIRTDYPEQLKNAEETIVRIRAFEELVLELFAQNKLSGTTHSYIGQEATAAGLFPFVQPEDVLFSNHRCHGHYLAYGGPAEKLLAEIMCRPEGLCAGRGGSQHIHYKNFYTNGIQGGIVPNAVGVALAKQLRGEAGRAIVFLGDGTLGQGVVYEAMNIAALRHLPVTFVVEDNAFAMTTAREDAIAGNIADRLAGFGLPVREIASSDIRVLLPFFEAAFAQVRGEDKGTEASGAAAGGPQVLIVHTWRLGPHSKGDDPRPAEEIAAHRAAEDPLRFVREDLGEAEVERLYNEERARLLAAAERLEKQAPSVMDAAYRLPALSSDAPSAAPAPSFFMQTGSRFSERLREAFEEALTQYPEVVFLGEDIRDPYGGCFKATKGLSTHFPERVLNMPISEACMAGLCVGMALAGAVPVMEVMFGDFVTLCFDQLLNHAAKYGWVYGEGCRVPMILRAPMGARRGYGPTHSQSLEKFLTGIPLIRVLALSPLHDPKALYETLFAHIAEPTVVIENKSLYGSKCLPFSGEKYGDFHVSAANTTGFPTFLASLLPGEKADAVILTYGGSVSLALEAARALMYEEEVHADVCVLSQLSPLPLDDLMRLLPKDAAVITLEEGTLTSGIGAELVAALAERGIGRAYRRIAAPDLPIPNGIPLESQLLPGKDTIFSAVKEVLR